MAAPSHERKAVLIFAVPRWGRFFCEKSWPVEGSFLIPRAEPFADAGGDFDEFGRVADVEGALPGHLLSRSIA